MKLAVQSFKDLQGKKPADINAYVVKLRVQLAELQHQVATGKEKQTHQLRELKRSIAQAHTVLTAKGKEQ